MTDCLIVGFNDSNFADYVGMVKSMGTNSGAFRDLNLAYIDYQGLPCRSMDLLNRFYNEGRAAPQQPFHNSDFIWPVIPYLATYLDRRGYSFDYISIFHLQKDKLREKLLHEDILTVAITTTVYVSPHPILEIIAFIRQYNEKVKIIVGGPYVANHVQLVDAAALEHQFKYLGADVYVTCQEGELALVNLISALKQQGDLRRVDNIAFREGDSYVMTGTSIESNPLEENMVNYKLFSPDEVGEFISLRTAKSCPFSCSFCGFPQRAGKYKFLGVELVEQELDAVRDLGGVTTLTFIDDTFNVPKDRFKEILRMMITNNYGFKWNSFYRSDQGDEETIELMGKAGCEGVFLGVESGSDQMLENMRKTSRRKHYLKAIPLLRDAGISTHASLIIGFPGETAETVQATIDLIEEARPDFYRAQLWYADPVTPIWDKREEYGIKGSAFVWSHNTMEYQTACDMIDRMFLAVKNSIWLPQYGFEQWSTFYLQRKGMSVRQLRQFLQCFNATIKRKLINQQDQEIAPDLLESLKVSSQFDRNSEPDMEPVEVYSATGYLAAEQYWLSEFAGVATSSSLELLTGMKCPDNEVWDSVPCEIDPAALVRAGREVEGGMTEVMLAAFGILLSRLSGRQETLIVADLGESGGEQALPLRLSLQMSESFKNFSSHIARKIEQSVTHQLYGMHILSNPPRMAQQDFACPSFEVAYICEEDGEERLFASYPFLRRQVGLLLNPQLLATGQPKVFLKYRRNWFSPPMMEKIASYFAQIFKGAIDDPQKRLDEITIESNSISAQADLDTHAVEAFNFS